MSSIELKQKIVASDSPLISIDQLEKLTGIPGVKCFDVRGTWKTPARALPDDYAEGHIPGAVFLDWTTHFIDPDEAIDLASVADLDGAEKSFRSLGINGGDLVILYDSYHHMHAGRIWWAMRYWGFTDVRVLNGGWNHWLASNKSVSTDVIEVASGDFSPQCQGDWRIGLADFVDTHAAHGVIDARGPVSFAGTPGDPTTGHIPGALSLPYSDLIDGETSCFLQPSALIEIFDERVPEWRNSPIITSCGSGYAATVTLLALTELGVKAQLFDGSFSVWKQDPNRAIEQSL
ncbi:rhodanese-like domain-containing protein [uncultured Ruegeria sp.]|uniref:sulfurtransferase n=1 Tax=uncultured Ruegeria sp. TaxID=259304 RepID=UPI002631A4D8|nr:rhodanese-like domain-containing protein [uncultured Ruegeria sp.]